MKKLSTEDQQVLYLIKTDVDFANYFWIQNKDTKWFFYSKD